MYCYSLRHCFCHSSNLKHPNPETSCCRHIRYPYNTLIAHIVPQTSLKAAVSSQVSSDLGCIQASWLTHQYFLRKTYPQDKQNVY